MFVDSLADDGLGMKTKLKGDKILLSYPIAILAADLARNLGVLTSRLAMVASATATSFSAPSMRQ